MRELVRVSRGRKQRRFSQWLDQARRYQARLDSGEHLSLSSIGRVGGVCAQEVGRMPNLLQLVPAIIAAVHVPTERLPATMTVEGDPRTRRIYRTGTSRCALDRRLPGVLAGAAAKVMLRTWPAREPQDKMSEGYASMAKTAAILTALPVEFAAVRARLSGGGYQEDAYGTSYWVATFGDWTVWLTEVGAGNVVAATATERLLAFMVTPPDCAVFVGVAGGVKDADIGDVVVGRKVYLVESGRDTDDGFLPRPELMRPSYRLLDLSKRIQREVEDYHVHIGAIAASEKVVATARGAAAENIRRSYGDTVALEMEGYGFLAPFHARPDVPALVVRAVSDLLSGKEAADAAGGQELASKNAADFALRLLHGFKPSRGVISTRLRRQGNGGNDDAGGVRSSRALSRVFVHFLDHHLLESMQIREPSGRLVDEVLLAFELALSVAEEVVVPASAYVESDLCRQVVDRFADEFVAGRVLLAGSGSSLADYCERSLYSYRRGTVRYKRYRRAVSLNDAPPLIRRSRSATGDIANAWLETPAREEVRQLFWLSGLPPVSDTTWELVPANLGTNAFIVENTSRLLFGNRRVAGPVLSAMHSVINAAYFRSFMSEYCCGGVTDMIYGGNLDASCLQGPSVSFKAAVRELERKALLRAVITCVRRGTLFRDPVLVDALDAAARASVHGRVGGAQ